MRILHLCLGNFYIDGYNYQENVLPRINKEDGHEVLIIASTETFINNRVLGYVEPAKYETEYGVPIIRLPYVRVGNKRIQAKLRFYKGLLYEMENFKPDIIMSHSLCFGSVSDVIQYLKTHKNVRFFADTHTAKYNSGQNWVSLNILHRIFYKHCVQKAIPFLKKYFYIGISEKEFSIINYGVPERIMEFYPLGGILFSDNEYSDNRKIYREKLRVKDSELLLIHSGKLDKHKKTIELLKAFIKVQELKARLVIIGSISKDIYDEIFDLINQDSRIQYIGWVTGEELQKYLCACDIYLQPGGVSATMQNAVCCRCPIISYPHKAYLEGFDYGQFIWVKDEDEIALVLNRLALGMYNMPILYQNAMNCAKELLDYKKLASRIYN